MSTKPAEFNVREAMRCWDVWKGSRRHIQNLDHWCHGQFKNFLLWFIDWHPPLAEHLQAEACLLSSPYRLPPHIHYEPWGRDAPGTSIDAKQWRFRRPNGKQVKGPLVSSLHPFTQRRVGPTWDRMTCLWDPFPAQAQTRKRASTKHRQSLPRGGLPLNIT